MFNLILCFSEIPKIFICVCVRQVAFYLRTEKIFPSEAVSYLRFLSQKSVKGKHIENRQNQTCLFFSTRSLLQSITDLCRFYTLPHEYLQILSPIINVVDQVPTNLFHCFNNLNRFSVCYSKKRLNLWEIAMIVQIKSRMKR